MSTTTTTTWTFAIGTYRIEDLKGLPLDHLFPYATIIGEVEGDYYRDACKAMWSLVNAFTSEQPVKLAASDFSLDYAEKHLHIEDWPYEFPSEVYLGFADTQQCALANISFEEQRDTTEDEDQRFVTAYNVLYAVGSKNRSYIEASIETLIETFGEDAIKQWHETSWQTYHQELLQQQFELADSQMGDWNP